MTRRIDTLFRPLQNLSFAPAAVLLLLGAAASVAVAQQNVLRAQRELDPPKVLVTNSASDSLSLVYSGASTVRATIPVGDAPASLAISGDGAIAYVPNTGGDTLSVVDVGAGIVVATVPVSDRPAIAAVTPDGSRVWVGCANGIVDVVDTATNTVVATIVAGEPSPDYSVAGLAISPDGARAYVLWGEVVVVDTVTNAIVERIYAGNNVTGLALSPDGSRIYVSAAFGYGAFSFYGTVAVVDAAAASVTAVIDTWSLPTSIAVSPDGSRAYVVTPSRFVTTGYGSGYLPSPWVARLDLTTNTLAGGFDAGAPARNVAWTPQGDRVYATVPGTHALRAVDPATNSVVGTLVLGGSPSGLAIAR